MATLIATEWSSFFKSGSKSYVKQDTPANELDYLMSKKNKPSEFDVKEDVEQEEDPNLLFTKNGMPTIETLKHSGLIKLIEYQAPDEIVTERPKRPLGGYLIYIKTIRDDIKLNFPYYSF